MPDIQNKETLTRIFGRWPSFHDAEIISVLLDREGDDGPSLTTTIHLWQMTHEVDAKGYFVLTNHTLATLRFGKITQAILSDFNRQNVLSELEITEIDPHVLENKGRCFRVEMPTSYGCEASFKCQTIAVVSALAATP